LSNGKWRTVLMHRMILSLKPGDGLHGDHVDPRQTLDNRMQNLRVATPSQNGCNRRATNKNTSGFKGVSRKRSGWRAEIKVNGNRHYLGTRRTREEAHALYCAAAKELHGAFARTA
jgi:AP2 domain